MRKAKKFILNAVILTATSFLLRTVNVWFSVFISKKIGAEGMGVFQLILSIYMFAITLATSGIGFTSTRLVAEELAFNSYSGIKSVVKKCIYYSVFFSILSASLLLANGEFISSIWLHGKVSASPVYALAISLPFIGVSSVLGGYFTAVRRAFKSASAQIFETFIRITVTIYILNLFMPRGLDYACLALVLGGAFSEILSFLYLYTLYLFDKEKYKNGTSADKGITKRMLKISLPVAASSYIRSALGTYKQIIIPIGLEKSGISCSVAISQYGIIRGMVMPILMFPSALLSALSSLLIPEIAENYVQKNGINISRIISRIFKATLLFSICVSGILTAYSHQLSMAVYKNLDSAVFIRVFSPLIVIMYFDEIVDSILKGLNKQVSVVGINILDTAISIILLYTLLPIYGIKGYIIVIFVSEVLNGLLSIHKLIKAAYFELKFLLWIVIPTIAIAISIIIAKIMVKENLALGIFSSIGIYIIILFATKAITKDDFILY